MTQQIQTLQDIIQQASQHGVAVGHFNISDSTQFNAIVSAAEELGVPVIIGVSEGEKNFIGIDNAVALVRAVRARGARVYLNLDHGHSVQDCKRAIDAGFDAVMFDGSKLPIEENIAQTKLVVGYARAVQASRTAESTDGTLPARILVEGELGYIGASSKMLDEIPSDVESVMTTAEQAQDFVARTGVDLLAPSVGNLHGMLKGRSNPALDIARIQSIAESLPWARLVLHGGSGLTDSDFKTAINSGVRIVHINTEIRRAYRKGIEEGLAADTEQVAPYKYLNYGRDAVKSVVRERLQLFSYK